MLVKLYACKFKEDVVRSTLVLKKAIPGYVVPPEQSPNLTSLALSLGFLKSNCEGPGIKIEIVENRSDLKNCDLIGLSATAPALREAVDILDSTKIPIVIGGYGTLWDGINNFNFKNIIRGDGEVAFSEVIQGASLPKIHSKKVENLDNLKFPYRQNLGKRLFVLSSRGCVYRCSFCSFPKFNKLRLHSAEWFIDDILQSHAQFPKASLLMVNDDMFLWGMERLETICKQWLSKDISRMFKTINIQARADRINYEVVQILKKMNINMVRIGVESGSDRILNLLNKDETIADMQQAIDLLLQNKITVVCNMMIGIPGEEQSDLELTRSFIAKNFRLGTKFRFFLFTPYPGSALYKGENPLNFNCWTKPFGKLGHQLKLL